jgi:hypothetical protein
MSNFHALSLTLATGLAAVYIQLALQRMAEANSQRILTGSFDGVRITLQHRRMLLYTFHISTVGTAAGLALVVAVGLVQIGKNVDDEELRLFAYICAGAAGASSLLWSLGSIPGIAYMASVLKAERRAKSEEGRGHSSS